MNYVCTRPGLCSHHGANGLAEFRVVILRSDFYFLNRVKVGVNHNNSQNWVLIVCSIQLKRRTAEVLSLGLNLPRTLRVFAGRVLEAGHDRISRRQKLKRCEVAVVDWCVPYLLAGESNGNIGPVSLQLRD